MGLCIAYTRVQNVASHCKCLVALTTLQCYDSHPYLAPITFSTL